MRKTQKIITIEHEEHTKNKSNNEFVFIFLIYQLNN